MQESGRSRVRGGECRREELVGGMRMWKEGCVEEGRKM